MNVLMISIDKGLLGQGQLGDVVERHIQYGEYCQKLDIIVLSKKGYEEYNLSSKVTSYPTNSLNGILYFFDGLRLGHQLCQQTDYDLIVTQTPFVTGLIGLNLKNKYGSKLLVHFHGDFWHNKNWLREQFRNYFFLFISKIVVKRADGIRVMSNGQMAKLGLYASKARVISTPVDLKKYDIVIDRDEVVRVIHVGRNDQVKDYLTLVRSFKIIHDKFPNVEFVQVGADQQIKRAMEKIGFNRIQLLGKKTAQELIQIYHQASVLVLSSLSESFGKVIVEANACGLPVVSTLTTGAKDIIQEGYNGYLVPVQDHKALAERVMDLLKNPDLRRDMSRQGKKIMIERYGNNTSKIIQFWTEIINKK